MLKRLEIYVDAALLSFAFSLVSFMFLVLGPARLLMSVFAGRGIPMFSMVGVAVVIGTALAVWASWVLHRRTDSEPMTRKEAVNVSWVALGAAILAPALVAGYSAIGSTTQALWMTVGGLLLVVSAWLLVDAIVDLFKQREHKTLDVLRILFIGLLGASLVTAMVQPAVLGSEQDISPYVVVITAFMLVVALIAYAYDEFASWRKRSGIHA